MLTMSTMDGMLPQTIYQGVGSDQLLASELFNSLRKTLETGVLRCAAAKEQFSDCSIAASCPLSGLGASYHIGFYSNEQVICNMLHMAVQLALYRRPTCTQVTEPPSEEEQRLLGWKADASEQQGGVVTEACCQTEPPVRQKPEVFESKCVGVRIGGGYHITKQEGPLENLKRERRQRTGSHCRSSSVGVVTDTYQSNEALEAAVHIGFPDHPFAHGAVPEDMPASRYRVGKYDPSEGWHGPSTSQSKQSLSQSAHLYRVLRPVQHMHETEPQHETESAHCLSQSQPVTRASEDLCHNSQVRKNVSPPSSTCAGDSPPSPCSHAASDCDSDNHHSAMAWRSPEELAAAWYPDQTLPSSTSISVTLSPGRPRPRVPSGKRRPSSAGAIRPSSAGAICRQGRQAQECSSARTHSMDGRSRKEKFVHSSSHQQRLSIN